MTRSEQLFERAKKTIPGGVNSPVRAFGSVGGTPRFIERAEGSAIWDADGKRYIDFIGSWGPAIVGHAHPEVIAAVQQAAVNGLSFGAPTEAEIDIAEEIARLVPSIEQVRLVSSGTEATMSAIRLARGFTGRHNISTCAGCYPGHAVARRAPAGAGLLPCATPAAAGGPADFTRHTLVLEYNNVDELSETFAAMGEQIACVIIEPFAGNMNLIRPSDAFVRTLRELCTTHGAVLIYDEVMTGFRVALGGAQQLHGIRPDLTTLGKIVGGGMPIRAFAGRAVIMSCISPLGGVYQAGTLSGNPVAVAAGLTTLRLIQAPGFHDALGRKAASLVEGLVSAARDAGVPFSADSVGGMFGLYFGDKVPTCYAEVTASDRDRFNRFFHLMLDAGVHLAPSAYEAGFVSAAHSEADIAATVDAARKAFAQL